PTIATTHSDESRLAVSDRLQPVRRNDRYRARAPPTAIPPNDFDEISPAHVTLRSEEARRLFSKPITLGRRCPLWVKSGHMQCNRACPLYPRKRHQMRRNGMSAKGQKRTSQR